MAILSCKNLNVQYDNQVALKNVNFDLEDGDFGFTISDNIGMDSDGNMMMRMSDHMAMDMDSSDIHLISSWPADDDEMD